MKKAEILVIFSGGTLVMEENEKGALETPPKERAIKTLLNMEPRLKRIANLSVHYLDNIDSTNMEPKHWNAMTEVIAEKYRKFDGFVITHGTDTMAYTASALSYSLQNLGKPVVLTGAQIPGGKIETDARRNFVNAVSVASMNIAGVMVVFDEEVIMGSRASKVSESKLDAFETINWDLLGEIRIDIRLSDEAKRRHGAAIKPKPGFEENIAVVTLVPGTPVEMLLGLLDRGVKGLVLRGYGSGNIAYKYLPAIERANKLQVPVVVSTQCLEGATAMHLYDVGKQALDKGVIQAYDMSIESVVTKLMWALAHAKNYAEVKKMMHTNYTGEINKEGKIY
ncbi:MAG: asparaginase [Candidatus Liptonbacteria bacterium]|nr:asparaginase [Candidatus Liptonbacteria bacterium]